MAPSRSRPAPLRRNPNGIDATGRLSKSVHPPNDGGVDNQAGVDNHSGVDDTSGHRTAAGSTALTVSSSTAPLAPVDPDVSQQCLSTAIDGYLDLDTTREVIGLSHDFSNALAPMFTSANCRAST